MANRLIVPVVAGLIAEGCFIAILALGNLRLQVPVFFVCFGIACGAYLIAVWQGKHLSVSMIIIFAAVFRITLLFTAPSLSDDIYRYVWDGRVQWAGINPYLYAPVAEELTHLRDADIFPKINHADLPTIYPPMAQVVFAIGYGLWGGVWGVKLILVGADLLACWLVVCLLRHFRQLEQWALIYCWHPLMVVEIAGSGHIEGIGILAVLGALLLYAKGKDAFAFGVLGGAVLVKFLPLILVPGFIRWNGWRPLNWKAVLVLPSVIVMVYLPYAWMGAPVFGSLGTYAEHWSFNSPVFDGLVWVLGDGRLVRGVIAVVFSSTVLILLLKRIPVLVYCYIVVAVFVLLTPTLHPWYVLWLVPFLVFSRNLAWLGFSMLVVLSYQILTRFAFEGVWEEQLWVRWVEFGGLGVLLLVFTFAQGHLQRWIGHSKVNGNLDENRPIS